MVMLARKRKSKTRITIDHDCNGMMMTESEFDSADFEEGWRYELINGVLIVSPIPFPQERDPNEELGALLRWYRKTHPQGHALDKTLFEQTVIVGRHRRRVDRVIWTGLGRVPRSTETPTIIAEFVSKRKRDQNRDYIIKRDEFMEIGVQEYWVIDRFQRTLTVFTMVDGKIRKRVLQSHQIYRTDLLPGFELRISDLFAVADDWSKEVEHEETN
jgi:Uma2 family endonuclease